MRMNFALLVFACSSALASAQTPSKIYFRRDVVPILETRCFSCHRGNDAIASYRLDLRAELLGETTGKPLVKPGDGANSRLLHVVQGKVPNKLMPRKGPRLTEREIDVLRAWIDQGLAWDDKLFPADVKSDHWAFQPIVAPAIPKAVNATWIATPVDAFIAAKHRELGLKPAPLADARTLHRRLSLDITGLPPNGSNADETWDFQVEKTLASPHYGERWGRHWLDVARFAESEGYESNHLRLHAWRYRDWVVNAFNRDLPFKDFVRQQLAGDEITPYADEHVIATGFLAAARLSSNEEDRIRQRNDIHVDIVNTTASAFLGLTMSCAQCHNHKFDPITARDYYRFMGFFVKGQPGNLALREPKLWAEYDAKKPQGYDVALSERDSLYALAQERKYDEVRKELSPAQLQALALPREERTLEQDKWAREADLLFQSTAAQFERMLTPDEKKRYDAAKKAVTEMEKWMVEKPQSFGFYSPSLSPHTISVLPMKGFYPLAFEPKSLAKAKAFLYESGDAHRPAFAVEAGWPSVLGNGFSSPKQDKGELSRSALADWLTSDQHPLAARVYVNRIWQHHFGRGLVATPNDFGVKGAPPTHPELLDWLASELLRTGSTKHIHRLIVRSSVYRQAATGDGANAKRDPDNQYYWRWSPRRLEAEAIRDSFLAVSGELDRTIGGPSSGDDKSLRRGLYLLQKRDVPPIQQALFDGPIAMTESCAKRQTTTVALQPLYLLNSKFSVERAHALAERVKKEAGDDRARQIAVVYRVALGRTPNARERELGERFFERLAGHPTAIDHYCQAIMNLNEFVTIE
jgi:hypothetical protein